MRVLLTGGSGFVGGHIARALATEGHQLRLLVRPTSDTSLIDHLGFERSVGDLRDADALRSACRGVEAVVHSAALLRAARASDFLDANATGTADLAQAAVAAGVERFVYISSIAAQGPAPTTSPEPPDTTPHPVSPYGRSKAEGESALLAQRGGMHVAIVRPPVVYGPGDRGLHTFFWMARRGLCIKLGDGSNLIDVIYGPDLADAVVALLQASPQRAACYHACDSDGPYDWNQLLQTLGQAAGRRLWTASLSPGMFHGLARASELWAGLTRAEPTLDRARVLEMRQRAWLCDPSSLIDDTGWRAQTPLLAGLQQTLAWYIEHGWV